MAEEILTLMADLDDESQKIMAGWYEKLRQEGFEGTQTPGLPYHISLSTFSLEREKDVIEEMGKLSRQFSGIPIEISHFEVFPGGKVLYGALDHIPSGLRELHDSIQVETIDQYSWTPHATILIDEADIIEKAVPVLAKSFFKFNGTITRLHLCAFWPTREIATVELKK